MDRRVGWIVWKGAFAIALYCAVVEQAQWIQYALIAFVWYMLFTLLSALLGGDAPQHIEDPPVLLISGMTFDLGVLAAMFLAHWYWTAFAYSASRACIALLLSRTASKPR